MPKVIRSKFVSRASLVRRFTRRALAALREMRRLRADGISIVLLHEHNVSDSEGNRYADAAVQVRKRLEADGWWVGMDARDIEQLGGQHMECISHVALVVRRKAPPEFGDRNERILER